MKSREEAKNEEGDVWVKRIDGESGEGARPRGPQGIVQFMPKISFDICVG